MDKFDEVKGKLGYIDHCVKSQIKQWHWQALTVPEHKLLGHLYGAVESTVDTAMEFLIGYDKTRPTVSEDYQELKNRKEYSIDQVSEYLLEFHDIVDEMKSACSECGAVGAIFDELMGAILKARAFYVYDTPTPGKKSALEDHPAGYDSDPAAPVLTPVPASQAKS